MTSIKNWNREALKVHHSFLFYFKPSICKYKKVQFTTVNTKQLLYIALFSTMEYSFKFTETDVNIKYVCLCYSYFLINPYILFPLKEMCSAFNFNSGSCCYLSLIILSCRTQLFCTFCTIHK